MERIVAKAAYGQRCPLPLSKGKFVLVWGAAALKEPMIEGKSCHRGCKEERRKGRNGRMEGGVMKGR